MSENNIAYAGLIKRSISFFVDYTIITFIRSFVLKLFLSLFILDNIQSFFEGLSITFGNNITFDQLGLLHLSLFLENIIFVKIMLVVSLVFAVGPLYYIIMTCGTKIGTTLGRKIFNVYPINRDGDRPSWLRVFVHYMASLIPIFVAIYVLTTEAMVGKQFIVQPYSNTFLAIIIIAIISWYDLIFITRKKSMVHDIIAGLNFVSIYAEGQKPISKEKGLFCSKFIKNQINKIKGDSENFAHKVKNAKQEAEKKAEKIKNEIKARKESKVTKTKKEPVKKEKSGTKLAKETIKKATKVKDVAVKAKTKAVKKVKKSSSGKVAKKK